MDVRYTPEQAELHRTADQLARELGLHAVADLDDNKRAARLASSVAEAGWHELRCGESAGEPLASGVEAAIIAESLAGAVADVAYSGLVLAGDLARRSECEPIPGAVVAFSANLVGLAEGATASASDRPLYAMDAGSAEDQRAYVLMREGDRYRLATVPVKACGHATDLTRRIGEIAAGTEATIVPAAGRTLNAEDLAAVSALGLTLTTADLVGIMRGVTDLAVAYATERRQYGVAVGSFQSIQHLLAEAHCLTEGARSALLHAAWAVDALPPVEALAAGRIAKAFAARAARTVCETSIQVHGGMGNTWECMAHVYLRRALLSERWFGDAGEQLRQLGQTRLGAKHGLS